MTAKVRVNMFPCENKTEITVTQNDEGDFIVEAKGTCAKAIRFLEGLGPLSITDLSNKKESKIFRDFINSEMSANCVTLPGVMTAAWVEAGMIARSNARKGIPLSIEFLEE